MFLFCIVVSVRRHFLFFHQCLFRIVDSSERFSCFIIMLIQLKFLANRILVLSSHRMFLRFYCGASASAFSQRVAYWVKCTEQGTLTRASIQLNNGEERDKYVIWCILIELFQNIKMFRCTVILKLARGITMDSYSSPKSARFWNWLYRSSLEISRCGDRLFIK